MKFNKNKFIKEMVDLMKKYSVHVDDNVEDEYLREYAEKLAEEHIFWMVNSVMEKTTSLRIRMGNRLEREYSRLFEGSSDPTFKFSSMQWKQIVYWIGLGEKNDEALGVAEYMAIKRIAELPLDRLSDINKNIDEKRKDMKQTCDDAIYELKLLRSKII